MLTQIRRMYNRSRPRWCVPECANGQAALFSRAELYDFIVARGDQGRISFKMKFAEGTQLRDQKTNMLMGLCNEVRRRWKCRIPPHHYQFMFGWNAEDFAEANPSKLSELEIVYRSVRVLAEARLLMAQSQMLKTFARSYEQDAAGNLVEVQSFVFPFPELLPGDFEL